MLEEFNEQYGRVAYEKKSLLDTAIEELKRKANEYYRAKNNLSVSEQKVIDSAKDKEKAVIKIREAREAKLKSIKRQLDHQRMTLKAMAQVQADLDEYRAEGRALVDVQRGRAGQAEGLLELHDEPHHGNGLELLEKLMVVEGRPKPSKGHTAHHIVPGKGREQKMGRANRNFSYQARAHMHLYGIRINDPDNGVWLPRTIAELVSYAMQKSQAHRQCHTNDYEQYVFRELEVLTTEQAIRNRLQGIGLELQSNSLKYMKK